MQVCMRLQPDQIAELSAKIEQAMGDKPWNFSALAARLPEGSKVHVSQVSRICRGKFRTLSGNVVQVCKALNVSLDGVVSPPPRSTDPLQREIERNALALWDRTPEGADRVVRLLRQLSEFRR
jgi:hypothetical protein